MNGNIDMTYIMSIGLKDILKPIHQGNTITKDDDSQTDDIEVFLLHHWQGNKYYTFFK